MIDVGDPMTAVGDVLAFSSRDWSTTKGDAWLYGIVLGWDDDSGDDASAMDDVATRHGWTQDDVARLRRLHTNWQAIQARARLE